MIKFVWQYRNEAFARWQLYLDQSRTDPGCELCGVKREAKRVGINIDANKNVYLI